MTRGYDVVVVGLGAMGGAVVHQLAKRGVRVCGVDRYDPPHAHGSSHGESRIIREAYFEDPVYVPLVRRAFELWDELADEVSGVLYRRTGALAVGPKDSPVVAGASASAELHRVPVTRLDHDALSRGFPMFRAPEGWVGVLESRAGVLDAEGCVAAQLVAAEAGGAVLRTEETVLSWTVAGQGVTVRTDRGEIEADRLVLAAGPWMPALLPDAPLAVERQVMLWFEPRYSPLSVAAEHCPVFLFDTPGGLFYGVPDLGGGVKAARHHGAAEGVKANPDGVSEGEVEDVRRFLADHVPAANGALRRSVVCRYTNAPDSRFIIDRHPDSDRVHVVSACSGHGFKFASAVGEAVAQQIVDGRSALDLEAFRYPA